MLAVSRERTKNLGYTSNFGFKRKKKSYMMSSKVDVAIGEGLDKNFHPFSSDPGGNPNFIQKNWVGRRSHSNQMCSVKDSGVLPEADKSIKKIFSFSFVG